MFDFLKNVFLNRNRYKTHSKAVVVACFFNPQKSPYRLVAFQKWYHSIKHLNHRIIECLIGEDAESQLPESPYIVQVHADTLLWHKETLFNRVVAELPEELRYVFLMDADVLLTNDNWLVEGVEALQTANVIQPFEYCIHLEKMQVKPDFDVDAYRPLVNDVERRHKRMWRSFCANHVTTNLSGHTNYDVHGHVGFLWGFRREILDRVPIYDRALIGGADHILAHAAAGQIPHKCIEKSFTDNLDEILEWSRAFHVAVQGRLGYVQGDLYHIWHGDIADRQYLKRIKDFTGATKNIGKDKQGFYVASGKDANYMKRYYRQREVNEFDDGFAEFAAGFFEDMGYWIWDIYNLFGQPYYEEYPPEEPQQFEEGFQPGPEFQAQPQEFHQEVEVPPAATVPNLSLEGQPDEAPASAAPAGWPEKWEPGAEPITVDAVTPTPESGQVESENFS